MRVLFTLISSALLLILLTSQGFAQCITVTQGDPVSSSACFSCPFPAAGISGNNGGSPPTPGGNWCTSIENDQFIGFTAICNNVQFGIQVSNCTGGTNGDGLQIAIVDADFNLFNCTSGIANGSTFSATLPTCGDYYIRLDGVSGSACDYTITAAAGVLDGNFVAPTTPATIAGPTFLCADQTGQYQITPPTGLNICPGGASICSELCWDISFSSPLLASEVTATPTDAFGFGCIDNQEQVVELMIGDLSSLPPGSTDTIYLSATPNFGCAGPGVQSEVLEIVVSRPPDSFAIVFTCPGEDFFVDGTGYSPGGHVIEQFDPSGCPFDLNLNVQQYPPNFGPTLPLAVCGLTGVTICPSNPIINPPAGLNTCNLGPIASNGCDSLIQYDVYYLDPMAVINALDTALDCTLTSVTASVNPGSTQGDTIAYNWTTVGGSISTNVDSTVITITDAGTYYLEVVMWSDVDPSQTCEARDTLIVTSDATNPLDTPMIAGPIALCIGETGTYGTVADPSFTAYNWTAVGSSSATPRTDSFDVVWNTAGTYDVCLTVENICETSEQRCLEVIVSNDQPTFSLVGTTAACINGNIALGITPFDPAITYTITGMPPSSTVVIDNDTVRVTLATVGGNVCVTGQGTCGPNTQVCEAITLNSSAAAPQVTGPSPVCAGDTETYQITADPLIASTSWTIIGGSITSSTNTQAVVTWTIGTGRQICAEITDACGVVQQDCLPVIVNQGPTATMRGGGTFCAGTNNVTVEIDLVGQAPFTITYTVGGTTQTETSNASPIVISTPAAGTYVLTGVSDDTGCTGMVSGTAVVIENPLPTATLSGAFDLCANSSDQISFDVTLTGTAPWTLELALNGAPLTPVTVNTSPHTVTVMAAGTYTVSNLTDATTCIGAGTGSVVVTERQPVTVLSVRDSCLPGNTGFIVIVELANGDVATYQNTGTDPGSFVGSTFTSSSIPSGNGYSFIFSDQYGCSPQTVTQAIVNCSCNNEAGTMARDTASLCGPGTITLPAATSGLGSMGEPNDVLAYYLHTGAFGSLVGILDSALTPSFTFDAARYNLDQVYYVSAVSADVTGAGYPDRTDPCLDVALGQPVIWRSLPTVQLSTATDACEGEEIIVTLNLTGNFPLTVNYTFGGVAASQTFAASPASLRITAPATTALLAITSVVDQFSCSTTSTATVMITARLPLRVVSVQDSCLPNSAGFIVIVELADGDVATYQNTGTTPGAFVGSIFTSTPQASGTGYSFIFSDQYGCTPQTVANALVDCSCTNDAGTMARDTVSLCGPGTITLPAATSGLGSMGESGDVLAFYLHTGPFGALTGVLDSALTPSFTFNPATYSLDQVYYVSAVSGDVTGAGYPDLSDPCLDVSLGQPVVWRTIPTVQLNAVSDACAGQQAVATLLLTGNFPLTVNYTLGGVAASQTFNASPASLTLTVPAAATTLNLVSVVDDFTCSSTSTASIGITPLAEVAVANVDTECDGAGVNYNVTFEITGGDLSTIMILPAGSGTLVGNMFTSNPIPEGTGYSFTLSDGNACNSLPVTAGPVNCACITMVGTIGLDTLRTCGATPLTAIHNHSGSTLDADDVAGYVLHTLNGATLGTVFAQSTAPTFNIDIAGGMSFGTVYYISPAVGNGGPASSIDLSDPCLSVAPGTPVIWEDGPTADLQGETILCEGGSTMITFVFTGDGPFTANMVTSDGGRDTTFTSPGPTVSYFVSPSTGTIYVLTEVSTTSCTIFPNDTIQIGVDELLTAGTASAEQTLCANDDSQIDLAGFLAGADIGGVYELTNGPIDPVVDPSTGIFTNTGLTGGQYNFSYTVGSGGVCPIDVATMTVNLTPAPVADAGVDQMLTCDQTIADLGGPNSSTGVGITYSWTGGTVDDPTAAQTTTTVSGTYTLSVTDDAGGCTVSEDVEIDISNDRPNSVDVTATPVDCDGGPTGRIFAGNVSGGTAPYRFTLDGSTPTLNGEFANLAPGTYTLLITDSDGCAYQEDITIDGVTPVGVGAGPDLELNFGETQTIQLLTTGSIETINWTGGPFSCVDSNFCSEITIMPTLSTVYAVTVIDSNGCEATDALQVIVRRERPVFVSTAFSPNGDGVNDFFFIQSPEGVIANINSFQIFDRWGENVFLLNNTQPNDLTQGWDGRYNGEMMNPAVFVFFAEVEFADGVTETIKGDFSLIR
ncbi:MAG: gliding motility-associated C-terminal domain-containing protein [Saprospiraceae bacterium]